MKKIYTFLGYKSSFLKVRRNPKRESRRGSKPGSKRGSIKNTEYETIVYR